MAAISANPAPASGAPRVAVLDLGSTSFTLLIAEVSGETIRTLTRERVVLRLGAALAGRARIPEVDFDRAVDAARALGAFAERERVERLLPVATSALREAENGPELSAAIGRVLATPVRVLSGAQEARLMFRAFQARLALPPEPVLGIDLGGGSLELAVGSADGLLAEASLPLGVARLQRALVAADPMRPAERDRLAEHVRTTLEPRRAALLAYAPRLAIASGGGPRALQRIHAAQQDTGGDAGGAETLTAAALRALAVQLVEAAPAARLAIPGMDRERADLIPIAGVILTALAEALRLERISVCDWGLREGVLLEAREAGP